VSGDNYSNDLIIISFVTFISSMLQKPCI